MRTRQFVISTIAAWTLALAPATGSVFAASSASVGLNVTANVAAKCIVSSTADVAFGAYDSVQTNSSTGSDLDSTGTVTIRCTPSNGTSIAIDNGANASGSQRRM